VYKNLFLEIEPQATKENFNVCDDFDRIESSNTGANTQSSK